jgi:hypothetical protein
MFDEETTYDLGPCGAHGRMNCFECYDIDIDDVDKEGHLIVIDGERLRKVANEN